MKKLIRKVELTDQEIIHALTEYVMNKLHRSKVLTVKEMNKTDCITTIYAPFPSGMALEQVGAIVEVWERKPDETNERTS